MEILMPPLVEKYQTLGPRYTSYPPIPYWSKDFGPKDFLESLSASPLSQKPLSLYFHIPFCEERCFFCACNVIATRRKEIAEDYLKTLIKEIDLISKAIDPSRPVLQIHWGGGTPTYLSCEQIEKFFQAIQERFLISKEAEISVEIDPRVTTETQLFTLRRLGFNRISLGVQDFDPEVQKASGRLQPFEKTKQVVDICRKLKFQSIHFDLIYGLPRQTPKRFKETLDKVIALHPDRLSLFHFAYLPKYHPHQQKILRDDLPSFWTKMKMFCQAIETFQTQGYIFIGLDHFVKKEDELFKALKEKTLQRNFQGYTTKAGLDLIGLGISAVSFIQDTYAQNAKKLKTYQDQIQENKLATHLGHRLSLDDKIRKWALNEIFCYQQIQKEEFAEIFSTDFDHYFAKETKNLTTLVENGLAQNTPFEFKVTPLGRLFLRNIGMVFDAYLS